MNRIGFNDLVNGDFGRKIAYTDATEINSQACHKISLEVLQRRSAGSLQN